MDVIGRVLRWIGPASFPSKGRFLHHWIQSRDDEEQRIRTLPGGGKLRCNVSLPYEAMVWLRQEEEEDINVLRRLLAPGDVFIDCGANIGLWTIVASTQVGATGAVYAFEPNPDTYGRLLENIRLSEAENIHSNQVAVGIEHGSAVFRCDTHHNSSYVKDEKTSDNDIEVPVRNLDTIIGEKKVSGIKVDVEGYEFEVLRGAEKLLRQEQPWLSIEFNTKIAGTKYLGDWAVHNYLSDIGYEARLFRNALSSNGALQEDREFSGYCNLFYHSS